MPLTAGSRLGPYEVLAAIGAGGMGEVYRARDGTLNRDVALKVLPEPFARDAERLARFRREAQVLAALNHPNIAAIYGFEESTSVHALVLELVEGSTLADRITQGPIPVDEALPMAKQIADALEAAHEQGIIHRDLKPGNVKVRPDGTVKVLDFGLAKALEPVVARVDATASPTITSPAMMTGVGVLLGTAAYMSPEQAKGHPADKRSDVWAFGAVLYEMLTGRRAFDGEDMTEVLGAVVRLRAEVGRTSERCAATNPDAAPTVSRQGPPAADHRHRGGTLRPRASHRTGGCRHSLVSGGTTHPAVATRWGIDGRFVRGGRRYRCGGVVRYAPRTAFGGPHGDHHVGVGCVIAAR